MYNIFVANIHEMTEAMKDILKKKTYSWFVKETVFPIA